MKVKAFQIESFINALPQNMRGVLLYGPDRGLAKEHQSALRKTITAGNDDPFAVTHLLGEDIAKTPESVLMQAGQASLLGGRRVIIVTDCNDKINAIIQDFLTLNTDTFLILQAGDLKPSSPLRKTFENESEKRLAGLPCYKDDAKTIYSIVRNTLQNEGIRIDSNTLDWICNHMGSDRATTRSELEKLILYAGDMKSLSLQDVKNSITDSAEHNFDDIIYAAANGKMQSADMDLQILLEQGTNEVAILWAMNAHILKLHKALLEISKGKSVDTVSRGVFFKRQNSFKSQLKMWNVKKILFALKVLQDAEILCKKTGMPTHAILGRALYSISALVRK